jgi:glycosyltransferase involved in cell wall biosynthesis
MARLLGRVLERERFDLIVGAEIGPGLRTTPYLKGKGSTPWVIEDLEPTMISNKIRSPDIWLYRMRYGLTWWKHRRHLAHVLERADGCTVPSKREQAEVRGIMRHSIPLELIPNGLDLDRYCLRWSSLEEKTLIFPGSLAYKANFEAVDFFLKDIFPLILAENPGVKFIVTGRTDQVKLDQLRTNEQVVFTGYLEDVRETVFQSTVCIVPLLTGGGTRMKILESMALKTPVVSTSLGAEGLEVESNETIFIADTPKEFSRAVLRLLSEPALRAHFSEKGRKLVEDRYSWANIGRRLEQFLFEVVERSRSRGFPNQTSYNEPRDISSID